jgi:hypothetical protein
MEYTKEVRPMAPRLITATLAALSLAGILAAPALADTTSTTGSSSAVPSGAAGKSHHERRCPASFDAGDAAGVRICRGEDGEWSIDTTDPVKSGAHEYTGTLTTGGKFVNVVLVRPESDDSASIDGEGKLNYDFKTYSGIDGVKFQLADDATSVTFNLSVDGQHMPASRIWIGGHGRHPKDVPFSLKAIRRGGSKTHGGEV